MHLYPNALRQRLATAPVRAPKTHNGTDLGGSAVQALKTFLVTHVLDYATVDLKYFDEHLWLVW